MMKNMSKRIVIPLILSSVICMSALTACSKNDTTAADSGTPNAGAAQPSNETGTANETNRNQPAPAESDSSANQPDPTEEQADLGTQFNEAAGKASSAAEVVAFIDEHIGKATKDQSDMMIRGLHKFYDKDLEAIQNQFYEGNMQEKLMKLKWPVTKDNLDDIKDPSAHKLVETAFNGLYKLETAEGSYFPVVDYEAEKPYSPHLSPELNDYIALQAIQSNARMASDGGLTISWDELADRTILAEDYMKKYPESPEFDEVKSMFIDRYLTAYLYGLDNTPIFDFDTFKLLDEVKTSYNKVINEHPDTITAAVVKDFLTVLGKNKDQVFTRKNGEQTDVPDVKTFRDGLKTEVEMRWKSYIEHQ